MGWSCPSLLSASQFFYLHDLTGLKTIAMATKFLLTLSMMLAVSVISFAQTGALTLHDSGYLHKQGWDVLVFNNRYGLFGDEKASGVEIIHHGIRTATNGDVRLNPTPGQWEPIPEVISRSVDQKTKSIETFLKYSRYNFTYSIRVEPRAQGVAISVHLQNELPPSLHGIAGFNLEFLPSAYFRKTYIAGSRTGNFPLYPSSDMSVKGSAIDPLPMAVANRLILAPEDNEKRISIASKDSIALYDGRNLAQNGWFVLRGLLPSARKGKVLEWLVEAHTIPGWTRKPVIAHSQVGYHPLQQKIAVIETDPLYKNPGSCRLLRIDENGRYREAFKANTNPWGRYLRYLYHRFDFSSVTEEGIYVLEYGGVRTSPFRIAKDVYDETWHSTLDIFFPVQMDHMFVNEAYRVWHGRSHMDDALQAPTGHEHFDLYRQGPTTDTRFQPGEHIPGLATGGWYDAGDFDLRTQTIYATVMQLVQVWETFRQQETKP